MRRWRALCCSLALLFSTLAQGADAPQLVVIIDDIGYQLARGEQALNLPGAVTLAVLPHTPYGTRLAKAAHQQGQEVMLHAPMSNILDKPLGEGGLTLELDETEFRQRLQAALDAVPYARGVSNHMGSELTQQDLQMSWTMEELQQRDLYFVDSRTSPNTVAARYAKEAGIPHLSRHVFLDNERHEDYVHAQFQSALALAQRRGLAVVIGHPYAVTIDYLQKALPAATAAGVELLHVSEALELDGESYPPEDSESLAQSRTSIPRSAI